MTLKLHSLLQMMMMVLLIVDAGKLLVSLAPTQAPLKAPRPQAPFAPPLPPAEYKAGLARLPTQQRAVQNVVRSEVGIIDSIALLYSEPKFNTEPTTTTAVSRV